MAYLFTSSHLINELCGSRLQPRHKIAKKGRALAPEVCISPSMGICERSSCETAVAVSCCRLTDGNFSRAFDTYDVLPVLE
jgi:hypothetical protein